MSVNDTFQMIVLPSAKKAEDEIEMEPVFELDGDIYQIPAKPSAGMALGYLEIQTEKGPDAAVHWMMIKMLGEEGYSALRDHPDLDRETLDIIIQHVEKRVLGGLEGKSSGKSRHRVSKR
jgi:hypothetical protein